MPYIGSSPPATALTASDITDGIISADKLATNSVSEVKMADDAISLTELKAGTDGEIISWDASGNPVAVGAGTSGHFLKSQGAGSQPVFAAAGGGAWEYICRQTIGSDAANIEFKDGTAATDGTPDFGSTYAGIMFYFEHYAPTAADADCKMVISTDTGSSYLTSGYLGGVSWNTFYSGTTGDDQAEETAFVNFSGSDGINSSLDDGFSGFMYIHNTSDTAHSPYGTIHGVASSAIGSGARNYNIDGSWMHTTNQNVDAVKFQFHTGNILSGATIRMYGLKAS
tara:strand:+ start:1020 stop:1868 length:849 start_codon:yes stop_codon:yes gene_type:complete